MFFRKKTKQPQTEEQLQKEQKKRIGKEVDQMIRMALGFEKTLVDIAQQNASTWKRVGIGGLVIAGLSVVAVTSLTPLKRGLSLCYRGG